ncbi:hypothetical protein [Desulfobacter postgatei]|uniref:hypothetical protein n=1 Tax=Desulfobacter postgatei TaxID=2293 RepID=UPI00259B1EDC|nr:hypothetical protein [uncultured Desulfobacter sp.]
MLRPPDGIWASLAQILEMEFSKRSGIKLILDQYRHSYIAYARQIPKTSAVTDRLRTQAGRISDPMLAQAITP